MGASKHDLRDDVRAHVKALTYGPNRRDIVRRKPTKPDYQKKTRRRPATLGTNSFKLLRDARFTLLALCLGTKTLRENAARPGPIGCCAR